MSRLPTARHPAAFALLFLLALLAIGAGIGMRDPSPPDEPRFALAAQHMVESGDWLIPHRGSELYAHKPAPFMWAQAVSYLLVRDWQIAFLLPSMLAALGTLWLTVDIGRRLWSPRIGLLAGFALLATLQFGLQAKRAQIDMSLVLLTTLSLWGLLRHLLRGPDWPALALGGFAAGLGTVTKGVGFLALLIVLPWLTVSAQQLRRPPGSYRRLHWLWLPLGFVLGAGVWLLPVLIAVASSADPALQAYAQEIFFKQTGQRYANAWHHLRPAWYYLQVMLTLWLPGALLLPWLLPAWWRRLRRGDPRYRLLLGWSVLVLLFFSASPGKREVYLFPALPAVCLAVAALLPGLLGRLAVRRTLLGYLWLLGLVMLGVAASGLLEIGHWLPRLAERRDLRAEDLNTLLLGLLVLGTTALALAIGLRRRAGSAVLLFNVALWMGYGLALAPALDASSSARQLMAEVAAKLPAEAELGLLAWREQMLLQADRPAADFGFSRPWHEQWQEAGPWLAAAPHQRWLLLNEEAIGPCVQREALQFAGRSNRGNWWLVPGTAWIVGCTTPRFDKDDQAHDLDPA